MHKINTLTVGELKRLLERFRDDQPLALSAPSGDYWGTTLALGIRYVSESKIEYTSYHQCFKVPRDEEEDADNLPERCTVVLLS